MTDDDLFRRIRDDVLKGLSFGPDERLLPDFELLVPTGVLRDVPVVAETGGLVGLAGIRLVEEPFLRKDDWFMVQPHALREATLVTTPLIVSREDPYTFDFDDVAMRWRLEMGSYFLWPLREEPDPSLRRPRTFRGVLRQMRDIVVYEFRRASGTLRKTGGPGPDPRAFVKVTGLS